MSLVSNFAKEMSTDQMGSAVHAGTQHCVALLAHTQA